MRAILLIKLRPLILMAQRLKQKDLQIVVCGVLVQQVATFAVQWTRR